MLLVHIGSMIVVSLHEKKTDGCISSLRENSNQSHQSPSHALCLNFLLHFRLPSVSFIHWCFFLPGSILPTIPPLATPPVIRLPLTPITLSPVSLVAEQLLQDIKYIFCQRRTPKHIQRCKKSKSGEVP